MNIPTIEFRYSGIYNERYKNSQKIIEYFKKQGKEYPSKKNIENYINKMMPQWNKNSDKILKELPKITGLRWHEKKIIVYVIGYGRPFSDPLTIPIFNKKQDFINTLIHELIHQLFIQGNNRKMTKKSWAYFHKKYKGEPKKTIIHIPLYAILIELIGRIFPKSNLGKKIRIPENKEYKRSWKIVQQESHQNILSKFKNNIS